MPRYYFDVRNNDGFHRDEYEDTFEFFEKARIQAKSLLPDIARDELPDGEMHIITCNVRDEASRIVYRGEIIYRGTLNPTGRDLDETSLMGTLS